ncbi:MAG: hypothetical protein DRJ05_00375 [Bacteroidetes bacterium]|nr:MAG: hypothetical protein DRJ05_00375 [Bacteroidota bacterium]
MVPLQAKFPDQFALWDFIMDFPEFAFLKLLQYNSKSCSLSSISKCDFLNQNSGAVWNLIFCVFLA